MNDYLYNFLNFRDLIVNLENQINEPKSKLNGIGNNLGTKLMNLIKQLNYFPNGCNVIIVLYDSDYFNENNKDEISKKFENLIAGLNYGDPTVLKEFDYVSIKPPLFIDDKNNDNFLPRLISNKDIPNPFIIIENNIYGTIFNTNFKKLIDNLNLKLQPQSNNTTPIYYIIEKEMIKKYNIIFNSLETHFVKDKKHGILKEIGFPLDNFNIFKWDDSKIEMKPDNENYLEETKLYIPFGNFNADLKLNQNGQNFNLSIKRIIKETHHTEMEGTNKYKFNCIGLPDSNGITVELSSSSINEYIGILEYNVDSYFSVANTIIDPLDNEIIDLNNYICHEIIKYERKHQFKRINHVTTLPSWNIDFKGCQYEYLKTPIINKIISTIDEIQTLPDNCKEIIGISLPNLYRSNTSINKLEDNDLLLYNSFLNYFGKDRISIETFIINQTIFLQTNKIQIINETTLNNFYNFYSEFNHCNIYIIKDSTFLNAFPIHKKPNQFSNEFCFAFSAIIVQPPTNQKFKKQKQDQLQLQQQHQQKQPQNQMPHFSNIILLKIINYSIEFTSSSNLFDHCQNLNLVCKYWNYSILNKIDFSSFLISQNDFTYSYLKVLELIKQLSNSDLDTSSIYKWGNNEHYLKLYPLLFKLYLNCDFDSNNNNNNDQNYQLNHILFLKNKSSDSKIPYNANYELDNRDPWSSGCDLYDLYYSDPIYYDPELNYLNLNNPIMQPYQSHLPLQPNELNSIFLNLTNSLIQILTEIPQSPPSVNQVCLILKYVYPSHNSYKYLKDIDLLIWNCFINQQHILKVSISTYLCSKKNFNFESSINKFEILNHSTVNQGLSKQSSSSSSSSSSTIFIKNPCFNLFTPIHYRYGVDKTINYKNHKRKRGYENVGCFSTISFTLNNINN